MSDIIFFNKTGLKYLIGKLKSLVDDSKKVLVQSSSDTDLDIADEKGNVLARFTDGHIKTKNFDSSNISSTSTTTKKKNWLTCAHRGNTVNTSLHENTLAAYYVGISKGCDLIECDARGCSDGTLVSCHDASCTDVNGTSYTIASITGSTATGIVLSQDDTYGTQYMPTLEQVLNLCYYAGVQCNIDLKDSATYATQVANLVMKMGMGGKVFYATNSAPYTTLQTIMGIDSGARFIGSMSQYTATFLGNLSTEIKSRCYIYSYTPSDATTIRSRGASVLLTSVTSANVNTCLSYHPEILEYNHTEDFRTIEDNVFETVKLY